MILCRASAALPPLALPPASRPVLRVAQTSPRPSQTGPATAAHTVPRAPASGCVAVKATCGRKASFDLRIPEGNVAKEERQTQIALFLLQF